jgi:hypothetical protein
VLSLDEVADGSGTGAFSVVHDDSSTVDEDGGLGCAANDSASARTRCATTVGTQRCGWCYYPLGPLNEKGRRRHYCSQSCRQRAYQSRKRARQLGLGEGELVVSSVLLGRMNRRLQALEEALSEAETANVQATDERVARLCEAASRLRGQVVGPPAR